MKAKTSYFIFRIDRQRLSEGSDAISNLQSAGVEVDQNFGEVLIDEAGRFEVVRGIANDEIVRNLKKAFDIDAFVDMPVQPAAKTEEK
jgi:hypothetical protein